MIKKSSSMFIFLLALLTVTSSCAGPTPSVPLKSTLTSTLAPIIAVPLLPPPLYFISAGQVWSWEPNGQTLRQITHEASPVSGMDVSPLNGTLAYVSGNQLIMADTDGNGRRILVRGAQESEANQDNARRVRISSPVWSPDGKQVAYGLNGVNVFTVSSGYTTILITNPDQLPRTEGSSIFQPISWSPDGSRLFVYNGFGCTLLPSTGGSPLGELIKGNCDISWSNDGRSVFLASSEAEYSSFGIWQMDASTGAVTTLLEGVPDIDAPSYAAWPKQAPDGRLLYFYGLGNHSSDGENYPTLQLFAAPLDDLTLHTPLSAEEVHIIFGAEALWAPDASLVIISVWDGAMRLLRPDDSPAISLPASQGRNLRWGVRRTDYQSSQNTPALMVTSTP